jgi:hypothetical protein
MEGKMIGRKVIFVSLCLCVSGVAFAQSTGTLKTASINNPQAAIEHFKNAWLKFPEEFAPKPNVPKFYSVDTCMYSDDIDRDKDKAFMDKLRTIAWTDVRIAKDLTDAGYPSSVWREPLNKLTERQIDIVSRRFSAGQSLDIAAVKKQVRPYEGVFLQVLNTYRRQSAARLPEFDTSEQCGGDWIGYVKLNTSPRGGNLQVIREYFFQLCRLAGKAPYSSECDMWSPADADTQFPQGTYRYLAHWANGSDECNKVVFVNNGADIDKVQTNTIRQTGNACAK